MGLLNMKALSSILARYSLALLAACLCQGIGSVTSQADPESGPDAASSPPIADAGTHKETSTSATSSSDATGNPPPITDTNLPPTLALIPAEIRENQTADLVQRLNLALDSLRALPLPNEVLTVKFDSKVSKNNLDITWANDTWSSAMLKHPGLLADANGWYSGLVADGMKKEEYLELARFKMSLRVTFRVDVIDGDLMMSASAKTRDFKFNLERMGVKIPEVRPPLVYAVVPEMHDFIRQNVQLAIEAQVRPLISPCKNDTQLRKDVAQAFSSALQLDSDIMTASNDGQFTVALGAIKPTLIEPSKVFVTCFKAGRISRLKILNAFKAEVSTRRPVDVTCGKIDKNGNNQFKDTITTNFAVRLEAFRQFPGQTKFKPVVSTEMFKLLEPAPKKCSIAWIQKLRVRYEAGFRAVLIRNLDALEGF